MVAMIAAYRYPYDKHATVKLYCYRLQAFRNIKIILGCIDAVYTKVRRNQPRVCRVEINVYRRMDRRTDIVAIVVFMCVLCAKVACNGTSFVCVCVCVWNVTKPVVLSAECSPSL